MKNRIIIISLIVAACVLAAMIIGLLISSLKKLDSNEIGLEYDSLARELSSEVKRDGLYAGAPGFYFIIFPSVFQSLEFNNITCLDSDGVVIELNVSYQYKANPIYLYKLILQFKDFTNYKKILYASGTSAIHDACAQFSTFQFQSNRGKFQETLKEIMKKNCEELDCELNDLQVNNVQRPKDYETAVKEKEGAKENIRIAESERPRLILQAETEFQQALKQYDILLNNASTQARIIKIRADIQCGLIAKQFESDLIVYKKVMDSQGLDVEGLLSYLTVEVISKSKMEVNIAMKSPARTYYSSITG